MTSKKKIAIVPEKASMETDIQSIFDSIIGPEYLTEVTGTMDLSTVEFLDIVVDTAVQSILDLSDLLPNLKELVLDNSSVSSVRDLGVGLKLLKSLSLSSCGLHDIDGIGVLYDLRKLCLSNNYISDVTPLAMHENLEVVITLCMILEKGILTDLFLCLSPDRSSISLVIMYAMFLGPMLYHPAQV